MNRIELQEVLSKHVKWLNDDPDGERADLRWANLRRVNLRWANLQEADLRWANLRRVNLRWANLRRVNLRWANLREADLLGANLQEADLSQAKGLIVPSAWLAENFESVDEGVIVYKAVGNTPNKDDVPATWKFEIGAYLTEVCHPDRTLDCACGVNFGTIDWIKQNIEKPYDIWKCMIEWRYAFDVVVPYNTDGKARCGTLKLLEIVERN